MAPRLGPFELRELAGSGKMGEVWRASHVPSGRDVAVKVAGELVDLTQEQLQGFREEVRAQARFAHPGVVQVYDYGRVGREVGSADASGLVEGAPYLVMEYAEGGTLYDRPPSADWQRLEEVLHEILEALAYVHAREVIHRDLKPSNLLWFPADGASERPKLADFGLAYVAERRVAEVDRDLVSPTAGTPLFMAPEQFLGKWRLFGPWTDLYQIGAIAWEWICGSAPFSGENWLEIARGHLDDQLPRFEPRFEVPSDCETWLRGMLAKRPANRFRRAADASLALEDLGGRGAGETESEGEREAIDPRATTSVDPEPGVAARRTMEEAVAVELPRSPERRGSRAETVRKTVEIDLGAGSPWGRGIDRDADDLLVGAGRGLFGLREIPFVNRTSECQRLWDTVREVHRTRRPHVAVVEGGSGTGKSRLVDWVARRAHETGMASVLRAVHSRQGSPGEGLSGLVEDAFKAWNLRGEDLEDVIRERLEMWAPRDGSDEELERDAARLSRLATGANELSRTDEGSWDLGQFAVLESLLDSMVRFRDVVVVLDDIQWGWTALECMRSLLERRGELPITFLLTVRSGALASGVESQLETIATLLEDRYDHLELASLEMADQIDLVRQLLPLAPDVAEELARATAGNPLVASQIVGDWLDRDRFEHGSEGFHLGEDREEKIAEATRRVWARRFGAAVESLPTGQREEAGRGFEMAAALGRRIDPDEWAAACRRLEIEPRYRWVEVLVEMGLAESRADGWSFAHEIVVESLERHLREEGRWEELNAVAAETLEELYPTHLAAAARRRASYWLEAGEPERALDPLKSAIDGAIVEGATEEIESLLDRRRDVIDRIDCEEPSRYHVQNWVRRARVVRWSGRPEQAVELLERSVAAARREGWNRELGRVQIERAHQAAYQGNFDRALRRYERAESTFRELGLTVDQAEARGRRAELLRLQGRWDEAREGYDRVEEVFERVDREDMMQYLRSARYELHIREGRLEGVRDEIREARLRAREGGFERFEHVAEEAFGDLAFALGDWEEARERYRTAVDGYTSIGRPSDRYRTEIGVGFSALGCRAVSEAGRLSRRLVQQTAWGDFSHRRRQARLLRAGFFAGRSEFEAMERELEDVWNGGSRELLCGMVVSRRMEVVGDLAAENGGGDRAVPLYEWVRDEYRSLERPECFERVDRKIEELDSA